MEVKSLKSLLLIFAFLSTVLYAQNEYQLQQGTVVVPVDGSRAKELLKTEDDYTAVLSKFDLMSKCRTHNDSVTINDYLDKSAKTVKNWDEDYLGSLKKTVESVGKKISSLGLNIKMPERIEVILSDMSNEGGASGYTRANYIVLPEGNISESTFIHELFHIFSRYDNVMSEKIYNTIGFKKCNEVPYPPEIADFRISNPDAPFNNYYITLKHNDKSIDAMLVLFSGRPYTGGSFFAYMQLGLLVVEGEDTNKKAVYENGKPLILKLKEVKGFYEQTGRNTPYNIHAEELSADHFVMLLNREKDLPDKHIIDAMKKIMTEN